MKISREIVVKILEDKTINISKKIIVKISRDCGENFRT